MEQLRPQEHWADTIQPLLRALRPRAVWTCGEDELCALVRSHAETLGYAVAARPGKRTDAAVISGDPNYFFASSCLERAMAPGVGGEQGRPLLVVSATGWPHGERDGYVDPDRLPPAHRRTYARCLPDPDQVWLTAEQAALASSLESGGEDNGVRPAVQALLDRGGWQARFLEGFGGLAILVPDDRLAPEGPLSKAWDRLGDPVAAHEMLRRLDLELGRARLIEARLARALAEQEASNRELLTSLEIALDVLRGRIERQADAVRIFNDGLPRLSTAVTASSQRAQTLAQRVTEVEAVAVATRTELAQERTWVAQQSRAIARSQAWRLGHRLARTVRLLTFRRDHGTDAVQQIVARMERGLDANRS